MLTALMFGATASAQTINRANVAAGEATPNGGTFSIHFPVAFNDVTLKAAADGQNHPAIVVYMLTGQSPDGIRFSASETPFIAGQPPEPMQRFLEAAKNRAGVQVADVEHAQKDGVERLSFTLTDALGGTYFTILRTKAAQYMLVIQFPPSQRDKADAAKNEFFGSFKIAGG